jgi:predicted nucleic acid-binding protein
MSFADYLIGAHARVQADALLTRDERFYRGSFKGLKVIDPTGAR